MSRATTTARAARGATPFAVALVLAVWLSPATSSAASFEVIGNPGSVKWTGKVKAHIIPSETGLLVDFAGPGSFVFELRSKKRGKRVIVDIYKGDHLRSRNPIKLRPIGGGRKGYRHAALLAMRAPKEKDRFRFKVQGADLILIITKRKRFYPEFSARPFKDLRASRPEDALVAVPQENVPAEVVEESFDDPDEVADQIAMRDADIFSGAADIEEEIFEEAAVLGAPDLTEADAQVRLAIADDVLSIGGRLFSQMDVAFRPPSDAEEYQLTSTTLLDVYLDARPLEAVRAYARGRLRFVPTIAEDPAAVIAGTPEELEVELDQLWLKLSLGRILFVTVGQQVIKWGSGQFWNPTDFANATTREPFDIVDDRVGVPLLKLHLPLEGLGWNFFALAIIDGVDTIEDLTGAFRAEMVVFAIEFALSTAIKPNGPYRFGADISAGLFGLDLHAEASLQYGIGTTFWKGDLDLEPSQQRLPRGFQRANELIFQGAFGAELPIAINETDSITVGMEYYFNDTGYQNADLYTWLILRGAFNPLQTAQQYAALYLRAQNPFGLQDTTFAFTTIASVSDGSWLLRLDYSVLLFDTITLNAFATGNAGRRGAFRPGFKIPAQTGGLGAGTPLERGLHIRPSWVTVGLALLLDI